MVLHIYLLTFRPYRVVLYIYICILRHTTSISDIEITFHGYSQMYIPLTNNISPTIFLCIQYIRGFQTLL